MAIGIFIAAKAALSQDLSSRDGEKNKGLENSEGGHLT
jgi:hypothetical protein